MTWPRCVTIAKFTEISYPIYNVVIFIIAFAIPLTLNNSYASLPLRLALASYGCYNDYKNFHSLATRQFSLMFHLSDESQLITPKKFIASIDNKAIQCYT